MMADKILALSKHEDVGKLTQFLDELDEAKLSKLITSHCHDRLGNVGLLLNGIFRGSSCDLNQGLKRRQFVFQYCLKILNDDDVATKVSAEIIGCLLLQFDETTSKLLCELAEQICQSVKNDVQCNGRIVQLLPKILSTMASRDSVPLSSDGGGELSGEQYKSQFINTLCSIKWDPSCVIHLANMFREVSLSDEELRFAIEKIIRMFTNLELEEVPPVVYQLLILSSKGHRIVVLEGISSYFSELDDKCSVNEDESSVLDVIPKDQLRHTEGNVILHVTFAIKQDQELGKEFVKHMKVYQEQPHDILKSFKLAMALSVARIHRFEESIFDLLKAAVLKSFKDVDVRRSSKWIQDNTDSIPDISKELLQTVENSMFGWDQVAQGIVQLGFNLIDAFGSKCSDVVVGGHRTPQQEACHLGSEILLKTFQYLVNSTANQIAEQLIYSMGREIFRTEILDQILNRLLTKTSNAPKHYIDLLSNAVSKNPQALLDSLPKVKEAFEYLSYLPATTAQGLLLAVLPLIRISITLRNSLMLVLRKAMLSRNIEPRKIAISGFLAVLKCFKVHGSKLSLSQSLSQGSQSSSHSSSQVHVDVHRGSGGASSTGNEALCLEILRGLRRCYTQQPEIRVLLYEGLYEVFCKNAELQQQVLEIIHKSFLKYYEHDEEIIPPVKLEPCLAASGDQMFLSEPLVCDCRKRLKSFLLSSMHLCVAHGLKIFDQEETVDEDTAIVKQLVQSLSDIMTSLTERMHKCELEDFELDKSADYSLNSGVGVKNNIYACLVMGIYEVLMEHSLMSEEYSLGSCESVLQSFKQYSRLLSILKEKSSAPGRKGRPSSSKHSAQSMMTISTVATLLNAVFSDTLPSHQEGLTVLRESADFVQYLLTVTQQKLNQINDTGFCDGAGGKNTDHIYKQCTIMARVLLKLANEESGLNASFTSKDKIINQSLHSFCTLLNIIMKRYRTKVPSFLRDIDYQHDGDTTLTGIAENDVIHRHIKRFERLVITILSPGNHSMTAKDVPPIINVISLLCGCLPPNTTQLGQVQSWIERICHENNVDDIPVTRSLLSLLLALTIQCKNNLNVEKEMAADIHKQLGDIDEDIDIEDESYYAIVNPRTAAPTALVALLSHFDKILDKIDWAYVKIKSEFLTSHCDREDDEMPDTANRNSLESLVCDRIKCLVYSFSELVQSRIPVGSCSEALLKTLTKFYTTLGIVSKYYMFLYTQKTGYIPRKFEDMVKHSGTKLSQQVYSLLTYVQSAEQDDLCGAKENGKEKGGGGNLGRARAMKEMKSIPNLIYAVEQYERYLIQLTKKSKVNFMENFKRSTSRDFRINGATLEAALREESSDEDEKENAKEQDSNEQGEPPRKKGKS